jgi:hypothetical protein
METGTYRFHEPNPQWSTQKGGMFAERAFLEEKISHKRSEWMCSKSKDQASQSWEGKFMKRIRYLVIFLSCVLALGMSVSTAQSAPTVTVTNVDVDPNPVCTADSVVSVDVYADLTLVLDSATGPSTTNTCSNCNNGNNYCGTSITSISRKNVAITTSKSYSNGSISASASDDASHSTGPATVSTGTGVLVGALNVGPEGKTTVTVKATGSETESTTTTTTTSYYTGNNCTGAPYSSSTVGPTTDTATINGSQVSASADYRTDLVGPTIETVTGVSDIQQGQGLTIGLNALGGSSGAAYTATFTATNDGTTLGPFTETDNFPTNQEDSGVQGNHHIGPVSLSTSCSTPIGEYTLTAKLDSNDLCGNPEYTVSDSSKTFNVTAGMNLQSQTIVVSEFPDGEYDFNRCFTSTQVNKKINNSPGYVHITEEVTSAGPCADLMDLTGVKLTLTLPDGFTFAVSGRSPAAHVFVFNAGPGYDYHYPPNEVTSQVLQTRGTQVVTIDLSNVNVGFGVGKIPSNWTIFARAKASNTDKDLPSASESFLFKTSATADGPLSADSEWEVIGNPAGGCVNGKFPE